MMMPMAASKGRGYGYGYGVELYWGYFCSGYGVAFLRYLMYHVGLALTGEDKESCPLA